MSGFNSNRAHYREIFGKLRDTNVLLTIPPPPGVYWQRTGGKTHRVTIVREDEPMTFRGIPIRVLENDR
jgi:hypothetical protein